MADTSVYGWATLVSERSKNGMQRTLIPFIPAFYVNQSELVLSHRQDVGEIRVLGVDRVLEKLEVCEVLIQNITEIRVLKKESIPSPRAKERSFNDLIKLNTGSS